MLAKHKEIFFFIGFVLLVRLVKVRIRGRAIVPWGWGHKGSEPRPPTRGKKSVVFFLQNLK